MGYIGFQILRLKFNDRVKPLPPTTFLRQPKHVPSYRRGRRGRDRMVVGFTTTHAISAYHHLRCEFEFYSWRGVLDTALCDKVCQ